MHRLLVRGGLERIECVEKVIIFIVLIIAISIILTLRPQSTPRLHHRSPYWLRRRQELVCEAVADRAKPIVNSIAVDRAGIVEGRLCRHRLLLAQYLGVADAS